MQFELSNYRIEESIGEGGMAVVYRAVQKSLERPVALKILNPLHSKTPEFTRRFLNEGRIIASLEHTNVVTIHDIGVENGLHFIAMEYLPGGDLRHRIRQGITVELALDYLETIANALHAAHVKHIVHRDVKPANVLFRADGTLVLSDFGIAKRLGSEDITLSGSTIGSPHYLSPEQARGRPVDARADIYSLGILLYEMLTGHKPFRGASDIDTVMMHVNSPPPRLPAHLGPLQTLMDHTTAKDPAERYPEAATLIAALRQARAAWLAREQLRRTPPPASLPTDDAAARTQTLDLSFHSAATQPNPDAFHAADTVRREPTSESEGGGASATAAASATTEDEDHPARTRMETGADAHPGELPTLDDAGEPARTARPPPPRDAVESFDEARPPAAAGSAVHDARPRRPLPLALAAAGLLALMLGGVLLIDVGSPPPSATAGGSDEDAAASARASARRFDGDAAVQPALDGHAAPSATGDGNADAGATPPAAVTEPAVDEVAAAADAGPAPPDPAASATPPPAAAADTPPPANQGAPATPPPAAAAAARAATPPPGAAPEDEAARRPREFRRAQVAALLVEAERALDELRLTRPAGDNALEYARQAQALEPGDARAQAVIDGLVARYAGLARTSMAAEDYGRAREYLARGLEVAPGDDELLALGEDLARRTSAAPRGTAAPVERETTPMGVRGETPRELLERIKGFFD